MNDLNADEPMDALLRSADPIRNSDLSTPPVGRALDELGAHIGGAGRKRRRIGRVSVLAGAALAAVIAAGVAAPATAHWFGLRSGLFGDESGTEVDTSEFLNASSPELGPYLDEVGREYPLPPGVTFERTKQRIISTGGLVQRNGLRSRLARTAQCAWMDAWLHARASGDTAALAEATRMVRSAASWDIWAAVDGDGQLVLTQRRLAEAAGAGEPVPIREDFELNCDPELSTRAGSGK
ncbi:MAG TPA: hypothetical protein VF062_00585 [Candidatus Limnocylindrales bacterium]